LLTEGEPRDSGSVRTLTYAGSGKPKGSGKAEILEAIEENPDASNNEIAEITGQSLRYVQKIKKEAK